MHVFSMVSGVPQAETFNSSFIAFFEQIFSLNVSCSAVVDKRFVDKIGNKTAFLRKYDMSTDSVLMT